MLTFSQLNVLVYFIRGYFMMTTNTKDNDLLKLTSDIVSAYIAKNEVSAEKIPTLIDQVFDSLTDVKHNIATLFNHSQKPFVPVEESLTDDYIICLEDGKKLKMLKRHLRTTYNMTPEEYRTKWNLSPTYPMVSPNYAKRRSAFAKAIGLGKGENHHRKKKIV
jgi:predicted transcriptional regulator